MIMRQQRLVYKYSIVACCLSLGTVLLILSVPTVQSFGGILQLKARGCSRLDQKRVVAFSKKSKTEEAKNVKKTSVGQENNNKNKPLFNQLQEDEEEEGSWDEEKKRSLWESAKIPLLWERSLDTVEDAFLHLQRLPLELGWKDAQRDLEEAIQVAAPFDATKTTEETTSSSTTPKKRRTVVVLGSGWAAHAFLKVADPTKLRIIVVSPSNHFVFTPMLASAAVGTVEYRSMTEAVRAANPLIEEYVEGRAVDVDVKKKILKVQLSSLLDGVRQGTPPLISLAYDSLIVAVGCKVADDLVPGAAKYCLRLKSCDDARKLRTAVGESLEYASRPGVNVDSAERQRRSTFLIVGGGPTGVELAGELSDLAKDITRPTGPYPRLRGKVKVLLVHGGAELLPQFDATLRPSALKAMERRGIEVRLNTRVLRVGDGMVQLQEKGGASSKDKVEEMPVGLTIWCAGTAPVPFIDTLLQTLPASAKGPGGKVNVDPWLRPVVDDPALRESLLVLGDAAACKNEANNNNGNNGADGGDANRPSLLPQTAQVAGQQGAYAARLLCREYDLRPSPPCIPSQSSYSKNDDNSNKSDMSPLLSMWLQLRGIGTAPPFSFYNLGLLAYVGGGEALSQVEMGDATIFTYAGSAAFLLWRSVYLVKQVATRNRVLVTFDWVKSTVFGRDVTRL